MKTWAWIVGGVGVAAGAWWYLKGRNSATTEMSYPEGVVPGVTPGYPIAPSVDELPPDTAQQEMPMGGSYAPQQSSSQASAVSPVAVASSPSSSGAPYAVGTGNGPTTTASPTPTAVSRLLKRAPVRVKVALPRPMAVATPRATPAVMATPMATPTPMAVITPMAATEPVAVFTPLAPVPAKPTVVSTPVVMAAPLVKRAPTQAVVTTYRSPVTSATRTVVVPVVATPKPVVVALQPKSPTPTIVTTPLSKPLAVIRPTNLRGVYAVGADFTEAEYRAMGVRAELETRRREWAANQMAENTVVNARR